MFISLSTYPLDAATKQYVDNWKPSTNTEGFTLFYSGTVNITSGTFRITSYAPSYASIIRLVIGQIYDGTAVRWGIYSGNTTEAFTIQLDVGRTYNAILVDPDGHGILLPSGSGYLKYLTQYDYFSGVCRFAAKMYWK